MTESRSTPEAGELATVGASALPFASSVDEAIANIRKRTQRMFASNCNPDEPDDYDAMLLMQLAQADRINDNVGVQIKCRYIMVREWEQVDGDSGEITDRLRTVFVDDSGKCYSTNSMAVAELALTILKSRNGKRRFDPCLTIRFQKQRTLSGNEAIVPIIDMDAIRALNRGTAANGQATKTAKR